MKFVDGEINGIPMIMALDGEQELGYVLIASTPLLESKGVIEIDQLQVNKTERAKGVGSQLMLRAIARALKQGKGIHILIQPGSAGFWKKFFNRYFIGKRMTTFGGLPLNASIADGKVFELSYDTLTRNYAFKRGSASRCHAIEKISKKPTRN